MNMARNKSSFIMLSQFWQKLEVLKLQLCILEVLYIRRHAPDLCTQTNVVLALALFSTFYITLVSCKAYSTDMCMIFEN